MERLLISLGTTVATVGALYFIGLLMFDIFKMFGIASIIVLIAFIVVWAVWYVVLDDFD